MSLLFTATIRLAPSVTQPRRRGWRCNCRIDGLVGSDGEPLLGVEITPEEGECVYPKTTALVSLRLWAPVAGNVHKGATIEFFEGNSAVAAGVVSATEVTSSSLRTEC